MFEMINQLETFNKLSLIISSTILFTDDKSSLVRTKYYSFKIVIYNYILEFIVN